MPYRINIQAQWDGEANVWWATSPELPGLVSEAPSVEALTERVLALIPELIELPDGALVDFHAEREERLLPAAA